MKKCPKCSEYIYSKLVVCNKCGMPMLVQPHETNFPAPAEFIRLLKKQEEAKIKDTKPIPLFDDEEDLMPVSVEEIYGEDAGAQLSLSSKEVKKANYENEKKKVAYKTISIPLLKDKKFDKKITSAINLDLDEESEELIVSDFEDDDIEELGYEPEIVHSTHDDEEAEIEQGITEKQIGEDLDFDLEYMPLPGEKETPVKEKNAGDTSKESSKKEEPPKGKDLQRLTKLKQAKLNIEYIPDYPDSWEWVIFDNDSENKIGYQISGREGTNAKFDFLIFPDENISDDVMTKISDDQKNHLKKFVKAGKYHGIY